MPIEVWKSGLWGPRKVSDHLLLTVDKYGQATAKFALFSFGGVAVDTHFAANLLGGTAQFCKYSGMFAADQRANREYRFDVEYSALYGEDVTRVHCRLCGYAQLERGKVQTVPHQQRLYIVAPQQKRVVLSEANFYGHLDSGGLVSPAKSTRLIFCKFDTGLMLLMPSWVTRQFPDAELRFHWFTYAILEAPAPF